MRPQAGSPNRQVRTSPPLRLFTWAIIGALVLAIALVDQLSKHWADTELIEAGGQISLLRRPPLLLALTYVRNPGAAWGLLASADESFRQPFFLIVSLVAVGFIFYLYRRLEPSQRLARVALALVMGGAIGNFIDRLRFSYVIDFIDVRYGTFRWPTFNIADAAITLGVAMLLLDMFLERLRSNSEAQDPVSPHGAG
jgi:lipoprotein signal peptidase